MQHHTETDWGWYIWELYQVVVESGGLGGRDSGLQGFASCYSNISL